jgi:hypothetical protein
MGDKKEPGLDDYTAQIKADQAAKDQENKLKAYRAWIGTTVEDQIPDDARAELGLPPRE